jgi:hypothetical protein
VWEDVPGLYANTLHFIYAFYIYKGLQQAQIFGISQGILPSYTEEKYNGGKKSTINFIAIFSSNSI